VVRASGASRFQLPDPSLAATESGRHGEVTEAQETLARDLIYSGFFYVMDQYASPFLPNGVSRAWNVSDERPDQRPYRVEAQWRSDGGGLAVDLRLVDGAGTQLLGKRYQIHGCRAARCDAPFRRSSRDPAHRASRQRADEDRFRAPEQQIGGDLRRRLRRLR
jgi:hypothetical protein